MVVVKLWVDYIYSYPVPVYHSQMARSCDEEPPSPSSDDALEAYWVCMCRESKGEQVEAKDKYGQSTAISPYIEDPLLANDVEIVKKKEFL